MMVLVPLKQSSKLEILSMRNWCEQNIGKESPTTWFELAPTHTGFAQDVEKYNKFTNAGMLNCIAFNVDKDATAFRLVFGL